MLRWAVAIAAGGLCHTLITIIQAGLVDQAGAMISYRWAKSGYSLQLRSP